MTFAMVFPGQGSQSVAMMEAYGNHAIIRSTFDEASQALGQDLWTLTEQGPAEVLAQTVNTQPIMLAAGIAAWRLWREKNGPLPELMAGHSLGEYTALVAADVLDFAQAVKLVRLRATAMQEAVPLGTGAMAAIMNLDDKKIQEACQEAMLALPGQTAEAVNFNATGQTVIAGHKTAVEHAAELCKGKGAKRALLLPVSAPFHSSLMKPAAEKLASALSELKFSPPQIPVINNVDVAIETDPAKIKDALIRQANHPVRWVEIIEKMATKGITQVLECGPGRVLAGLTKRCVSTVNGYALCDLAAMEKTLGSTE